MKAPAAAHTEKPVATPSYPWYAKDWLTDETRLNMNAAERGIYRDLLDHQWVHGSIPKDSATLITILSLSREEFESAWPKVRKKFEVCPKNRSRLFNSRLETVRNSKAEWIQKSTEGGHKSGNVRRRSNGDNELPKGGSTTVQVLGSTNEKPLVEHSVSVSVSASDSVSVSEREERPLPHDAVDPDQQQPVSDETVTARFPLDRWAERLYSRHIKRRDRSLVNVACFKLLERCQARGVDPEAKFLEVESCLIAWNATPEWQEKNGQFAPKLAQWIEDEGYEKWPRVDPSPPQSRRSNMPSWYEEKKRIAEGRPV